MLDSLASPGAIKMTWLGWITVAIASLVLVYCFKIFLWPAWKNIPRQHFANYIRTLMRFYDDSAWLIVTDKASSISLFRFCRVGTNDDSCNLNFELLDSALTKSHRNELFGEIKKRGYEPILPNEPADCNWLIMVQLKIEDIWEVNAGSDIASLAHELLNIMNIDKEARFSLSYKGPRSEERTLEARKRQREGLDLAGTTDLE